MNRYYVGPWQWIATDTPQPHWAPPAGAVATVDLRPLPEQAVAGGAPGLGFFVADRVLPKSSYALLGVGTEKGPRIGGKERDAWESLLGYRPAGETPADLLWDHLAGASDPEGLAGPKPLLPGIRGWSDLHLAGRVRSEPFEWGRHPQSSKVRDVLRADFRRLFMERQAGSPREREHPRRVLDFWCKQYKIEDWREFVPADLRQHIAGRLKHETTLTDSFDRANADALGTSSEGWSWTEVSNDIDIVSNTAEGQNTLPIARAESDLSSADHYVQFSLAQYSAADTQDLAQACCRFAAAATTAYLGGPYANDDKGYISKIVAGVASALSSAAVTVSVPETWQLEVSGSELALYQAGVSRVTVTDTAITGNLRTGIRQHFATTKVRMNDFQAADLAAAPGILYTQLERTTRGLARGVYAGTL